MMLRRTTENPMMWMASVALALLVIAVPATAMAASNPWQSADLTLVGSKTGSPVLLISGRLPSGTALPAKVTLAIPPGATIGWAGEILGGDPSKDPSVKYIVTKGKDYDLISFTLGQARVGQVEVDVPNAYSSRGAVSQAAFSWKAPYDIPVANLQIQLPAGATVTSGTPGGKKISGGSGDLYQRVAKGVSKGSRLTLTVAYTGGTTGTGAAPSPAQPQTGAQAAAPSSGASPVVMVLAVGFLLAVTYFAMKHFASPSANDDSGEDKTRASHEGNSDEEWPEDA